MEKKESKLTSGKKKAVKIAIQASVSPMLIAGPTARVLWAVYSGGEFAEQEDDGEPFEEKMTRLTTELYGLFKESHELEDKIRKNLAAIGYGE